MPATKQVDTWTSAGRFMRLAKAITFCVPTTFVRRALSRVGLKVTLPALLMTTSMSSAIRLRFFFGVTEVVFADVAAEHDHLVANESFERAAVAFAQRIEGRRGDHAVPEARFRFFLRARAHRHVDAPDIRKAMQQHAERDFAEKAGAADQEDLAVL